MLRESSDKGNKESGCAATWPGARPVRGLGCTDSGGEAFSAVRDPYAAARGVVIDTCRFNLVPLGVLSPEDVKEELCWLSEAVATETPLVVLLTELEKAECLVMMDGASEDVSETVPSKLATGLMVGGMFGDGRAELFVVGVLGFEFVEFAITLPLLPARSDPSIDFCGFMLFTLPREAGDSFGRAFSSDPGRLPSVDDVVADSFTDVSRPTPICLTKPFILDRGCRTVCKYAGRNNLVSHHDLFCQSGLHEATQRARQGSRKEENAGLRTGLRVLVNGEYRTPERAKAEAERSARHCSLSGVCRQ